MVITEKYVLLDNGIILSKSRTEIQEKQSSGNPDIERGVNVGVELKI
jgi:hypothetical protein